MSVIDWTDAFENGAYIDGAADYPPRWATAAAAYRAALGERAETAIAYGDTPRQTLDLFHPTGAPKGLIVFVHGGYWKAFDPSTWSHLAQGGVDAGYAVALPGYTLAPAATIPQITTEVARAITLAAERIPGPIYLIGHSAGGHLVARMVTGALPPDLTARVAHCLPISGLFDLRPLRLAAMNDTLRLTEPAATAESPLLAPPPKTPTTAWVGAAERPEFLRQTRLLTETWSRAGAAITDVYDPDHHHFSVIDALTDATSPLMTRLLSLSL